MKVAEEQEEVTAARKTLGGETENDDEFFTVVEYMPIYPGGDEALKKHIAENIRYPQSAKEKGVSGTVYISYVVSETGNVTKVKVWRGVSSDIDNEAVRVVSTLKNYTPGMQRGKPVSVQMTIPVRFVLE